MGSFSRLFLDLVHRDVSSGDLHPAPGNLGVDRLRGPQCYRGRRDGMGAVEAGDKRTNGARSCWRRLLGLLSSHHRVPHFFLLWFVPRLVGLPIAATALALASIYLLVTAWCRRSWDLPAAAIVWIFSVALATVFVLRSHGIHVLKTGTESSFNAAWLAPVCIFGFALNPYLDLTFHRARQTLNLSEARRGIWTWFRYLFLFHDRLHPALCRYDSPLLAPDWREHLRPALGPIIAAHMIVQSAYTLSVHARSLVLANPKRGALFCVSDPRKERTLSRTGVQICCRGFAGSTRGVDLPVFHGGLCRDLPGIRLALHVSPAATQPQA